MSALPATVVGVGCESTSIQEGQSRSLFFVKLQAGGSLTDQQIPNQLDLTILQHTYTPSVAGTEVTIQRSYIRPNTFRKP